MHMKWDIGVPRCDRAFKPKANSRLELTLFDCMYIRGHIPRGVVVVLHSQHCGFEQKSFWKKVLDEKHICNT